MRSQPGAMASARQARKVARPPCYPASTPPTPTQLHPLLQDGKFQLGKLRGGKMDDITVVCAVVTEAGPAQAAA